MESSSWDGVAASLRQTNVHVESTFGAVVRENASLNAQRYAQDAAMAEMRCELARLRSEAADVLGRREVMEEAGRLEKRVAGLQRELNASNAAEREFSARRRGVARGAAERGDEFLEAPRRASCEAPSPSSRSTAPQDHAVRAPTRCPAQPARPSSSIHSHWESPLLSF